MPKLIRAARRRVGVAHELMQFMWQQKFWWLIPFVAVLLAVGLFLVLAQSSVIAPFIYTLF